MSRKHWTFASVLLIGIVGLSLYYLQRQPPKAPIEIYKIVEVEKPPPPGETHETGHWHGDEWHSEPHETHETPAVSAGKSYIPEGAAVTPDFPPVDARADPVEEAYKRLDYIKNNPYAWGGVHSERATELIAVLMPPPVLMDEGHGEEVYGQVQELIAENDPRAADVLITTLCEGDMWSVDMGDAFVEIGPPAVPYILPYLSEEYVMAGLGSQVLGRIAVEYRADLGGIVDHIIIPKFEAILMSEGSDPGAKYFTKEALAMFDR